MTHFSEDPILTGNFPEGAEPPLFHVGLVEPEIPQNTGNIGRTCVGMRTDLALIGQLGFKITDRNLKRAGLDYWQHLRWQHFADLDHWTDTFADPPRLFYLSTKATQTLYDVRFQKGDCFVFGRETKGLDPEFLRRNMSYALRIPILGPIRSYNVATSVAMVLSEAYRQIRLSHP